MQISIWLQIEWLSKKTFYSFYGEEESTQKVPIAFVVCKHFRKKSITICSMMGYAAENCPTIAAGGKQSEFRINSLPSRVLP